jgi:hypothetical protein
VLLLLLLVRRPSVWGVRLAAWPYLLLLLLLGLGVTLVAEEGQHRGVGVAGTVAAAAAAAPSVAGVGGVGGLQVSRGVVLHLLGVLLLRRGG